MGQRVVVGDIILFEIYRGLTLITELGIIITF